LKHLALISTVLWFVAAVTTGAPQSGTTIATGTLLPRIEGETLSAKRVALPGDVKGRVGFLVFSFSREAGEAARCWNDAYAKASLPQTDAATFAILMLGDVPWIIRGFVVAGIKSGVPPALHDRTLKVLTDDDAWRSGLNVRAPEMPHVVLIDRAGKIRWVYSAACDEAGQRRFREQAQALVAEKTLSREASRAPVAVR
jgi:hypothetical protein